MAMKNIGEVQHAYRYEWGHTWLEWVVIDEHNNNFKQAHWSKVHYRNDGSAYIWYKRTTYRVL